MAEVGSSSEENQLCSEPHLIRINDKNFVCGGRINLHRRSYAGGHCGLLVVRNFTSSEVLYVITKDGRLLTTTKSGIVSAGDYDWHQGLRMPSETEVKNFIGSKLIKNGVRKLAEKGLVWGQSQIRCFRLHCIGNRLTNDERRRLGQLTHECFYESHKIETGRELEKEWIAQEDRDLDRDGESRTILPSTEIMPSPALPVHETGYHFRATGARVFRHLRTNSQDQTFPYYRKDTLIDEAGRVGPTSRKRVERTSISRPKKEHVPTFAHLNTGDNSNTSGAASATTENIAPKSPANSITANDNTTTTSTTAQTLMLGGNPANVTANRLSLNTAKAMHEILSEHSTRHQTCLNIWQALHSILMEAPFRSDRAADTLQSALNLELVFAKGVSAELEDAIQKILDLLHLAKF